MQIDAANRWNSADFQVAQSPNDKLAYVVVSEGG